MTGTFKASIIDHVLAKANTGSTSIKFKLHLTENMLTGELADDTLYYDAWLTDKALEGTFLTLTEALGWGGVDPVADFNGTEKFVGVEVSVVVGEESYNDKVQTKVKFMNNITRSAAKLKPLDKAEATALSASLAAKMKGLRKNTPAQGETKGTAPAKGKNGAEGLNGRF